VTDLDAHDLRRILGGVLNDAIRAQKAKAVTLLVDHGRASRQHRNAVARLDELRAAHNRLQSLQVDYSHARMLLAGIVAAHDKEDADDVAFHLRLSREYLEVRG